MVFSCSVCEGLAPKARRIQAKELNDHCHTCALLRKGITAVLGTKFFDIIERIETQRATGEGGPLRVDVFHVGRYPKVSLQFYRARGTSTPGLRRA